MLARAASVHAGGVNHVSEKYEQSHIVWVKWALDNGIDVIADEKPLSLPDQLPELFELRQGNKDKIYAVDHFLNAQSIYAAQEFIDHNINLIGDLLLVALMSIILLSGSLVGFRP